MAKKSRRLREFFGDNRVGLVVRAYVPARDLAQNPGRAQEEHDKLWRFLVTAMKLHLDGRPLFYRVDVQVFSDSRYADCDAGKTADALSDRATRANTDARLTVHVYTGGDLFVACLNDGVTHQVLGGMSYSAIWSYQAGSLLTSENMMLMLSAMAEGAVASGLAYGEVERLALNGRLANTAIIWDNQALASAGMFDAVAAQPRIGQPATYVTVINEYGKAEYVSVAGVEEVVPLARIFVNRGEPCIAPIFPKGVGAYEWPDRAKNPNKWNEVRLKFERKLARQNSHLAARGFSSDVLTHAVMPSYRDARQWRPASK